jgi:hypothetical protein
MLRPALAVVLGVALVGEAHGHDPALAVDPPSGGQMDTFTVSATGFFPEQVLAPQYVGPDATVHPLFADDAQTVLTADPTGALQFQVVPVQNFVNSGAGVWRIRLCEVAPAPPGGDGLIVTDTCWSVALTIDA